MAKWPWRPWSMPPIFNTSWENPKMHNWYKFGDFSSNPLKVIARTIRNSLKSESKWPKWSWSSKLLTPIFNFQLKVSENACLVQIWWSWPKCVMSYRTDNPNFLEFWVKMAKMTFKVKVNDHHFQYQPQVSQNACLVQLWWFQPKSVTSYRADKVKFTDGLTDGQTDGRTDVGNDNAPLAWKAKG